MENFLNTFAKMDHYGFSINVYNKLQLFIHLLTNADKFANLCIANRYLQGEEKKATTKMTENMVLELK